LGCSGYIGSIAPSSNAGRKNGSYQQKNCTGRTRLLTISRQQKASIVDCIYINSSDKQNNKISIKRIQTINMLTKELPRSGALRGTKL
jgi:hypothetical protein